MVESYFENPLKKHVNGVVSLSIEASELILRNHMKKQIKRFSPHQNAKVFAVLMAVGCLPMLLPMVAVPFLAGPPQDEQGNPIYFPFMVMFLFPVLYLIFGYLSILIGCWLYNLLFRVIGGVECEVIDVE